MHHHHRHRRSPGRRLAAAVIVTAALGSLAAPPAGASPPAEPPPPMTSSHATVVAQGVIQVGTANHVWALASHTVAAPVELPAGGPTFVVPSSAPVLVRHDGGDPLGAFVEPGEAAFVPASFDHQLEAFPAADVLEVGVAGGEAADAFALTEGQYDLELVSDVLAPGESLPVSDAVASLVLVRSGAVQLDDGASLPAGYNLPLTGDFTLVNATGGPAAVLVAVLASLELPAVAGAPLPPAQPIDPASTAAPGGAPETAAPGSPTESTTVPGSPTPGSPTPGSPTPGTPTPGTPTPGSPTTAAPGPTTPGAPTTAAPGPTTPDTPTTPPPTAAPTTAAPTAPPTTAAPTTPPQQPISFRLTECSGGRVQVEASAGGDGANQRNIRSVQVSRENDEGAWAGSSNLSWIGRDTADHDEWSTAGVIMQNQNYNDGIRFIVETQDGRSQTYYGTVSGQTCSL